MSAPRFALQKGLSLIELLIATALSLLLLAGVLQIFLSSKQTYVTTSTLSRVQENGRFASEFLAFDIRNIGYKGECVAPITNLSTFTDDRFLLDAGVKGWDSTQATPSWFTSTDRLSGTDMILVKHAVNPSGAVVASSNNTTTAGTTTAGRTFTLTQASGIVTGTLLVAADPIGCDLFQNQSAVTALAVTKPTTGNFSHNYNNEMEILAYQSAIYFIKAGATGQPPSLWRIRYNTGTTGMTAEQLVEGVQDMQLQYAVGTNGVITGDYVDAQTITDWSAVVSVRFNLLMVSSDTNVVPQNQVISFNGADVTVANRRFAQVFTTTLGIRNRLP